MQKLAAVVAVGLAGVAAAVGPAQALERNGYALSVVVDGQVRPEYAGRGKVYVEALKGEEYGLRITNPLSCRVAVALAVDGLNTIDARHTDPARARKWVLEPYQTIEIDGWQVSREHARRFYFTGERDSYGAYLGKTDDLGVLEAVFFRERARPEPLVSIFAPPAAPGRGEHDRAKREARAAGAGSLGAEREQAAESKSGLADEYAATGIGEKGDHSVYEIAMELEPTPAEVLRIRYGFRGELARLGILPRPPHRHAELDRREHARGFEGPYCPDPSAARW
jgi:hypothetical protein